MKTFKNMKEFNKYVNEDGNFVYDGDINIEFGLVFEGDIDAWDIDAGNINAGNINALNIDAWNINAGNIDARDIDAGNINALNINAWNISARNINAGNISYYAFCIAYNSLKCKSIEGRRGNSIHVCLDSEIEYIKEAPKEVTLTLTDEQLKQVKALLGEGE